MNPAITIELQFFLTSILWGGILLLIYDILRIFRRVIKHGAFLIAVQDMIFWVAASLFIFSMIYRENNGIIRGYSILGMMLGSILYHFALSDFLVKLISKLIQTLLSPFKAALNQVARLIKILLLAGRKRSNRLLLGLKKWKISVKMKRKELMHKRLEQKKLKHKKSKHKESGHKESEHKKSGQKPGIAEPEHLSRKDKKQKSKNQKK
jgi:spore cortex biosynthesis protein YabQ